MNLVPEVVRIHREMIEWRHDFHKHPEMCFHERRTAARVAELLRTFGLDEVREGVGKTGVVGVLKNGNGPTMALRADMDALAFSDQGRHDHRSANEGITHACGHDGHTSMLLGAAKYLSSLRHFRGTVLFLFQPAEEIAKGALAMLDQGFLDGYEVQSAYALHILSGLAVGRISITPGVALAGVDDFIITVKGRSGHAGTPHQACDPIVASGALISQLQTIVSRRVNPVESVVVSTTSIHSSSDLHNVIPESVRLKGTVRYLNGAHSEFVEAEMKSIIEGIGTAHGVTASLDYDRKCPPLVNSAKGCELATRVANELLGDGGVVQLPPLMGGEDFSYFLRRIPGAFAFIGNGEDSPSLHNAAFDFNDDVLPIGASYFARVVEATLVE
jgi:hippurate hydrolase